jgi:type VI secretion system protein ImpF
MSRKDHEYRLTPSVLDRLIDYEPKEMKEAPKSRLRSLKEYKQFIKRDLEWLLNCRAYADDIDEKLEEVNKSVVVYGLPDITGVSAKNTQEQLRLTKSIESIIEIFEPRFINVKVTLQPISNLDKSLRFHIEAQLDIEPAPEPIAFDTVLELGKSHFELKEK